MSQAKRIRLVVDSLPRIAHPVDDLLIGKVIHEVDLVREVTGHDLLEKEFFSEVSSKNVCEVMAAVLVYRRELGTLFRYALLESVLSVPGDLRPIIFVTLTVNSMRLKQQLNDIQNDVSKFGESSELFLLEVMKTKVQLAFHLMTSQFDQPAQAIPYLKECIEFREEWCQRGIDLWPRVPGLFYHYGEALMYADLEQARVVLEKTLVDLEEPEVGDNDDDGYNSRIAFNIRANLALIYHKLGLSNSTRDSHVLWVIKFLKNHEDQIDDDELSELLIRPIFGEHPVLTKLGGEEGLQRLRNKTLANPRCCNNCRQREPVITLFRCGGCRIQWYCSKTCQAKGWKYHKAACRLLAEKMSEIENMRRTGAGGAPKFDADFMKWSSRPRFIQCDVFIHALGVHKDPKRLSTHALFLQIKYNPASKDSTQKFIIAGAGVYKLSEAVRLMEELVGLERGGATPKVVNLLKTYGNLRDTGFSDHVPTLYFLYNNEGQHNGEGGNRVWITCTLIPPFRADEVDYDPEWRKLLNKKTPPKVLVWSDGPEDREQTF